MGEKRVKKVFELIKRNKFVIGLFIFSFIIRLIAIITIETPIISDFDIMYRASLDMINHTENYKNATYFCMWGYQMGHVMYQAFLLKICNSVFFLKLVNCIVTSFTVVFVYLIGKKVASEKSAKIASILYSIFIFPWLLNTVLTNQLLPILLTLIAIYILINMKDKYIAKSIAVGLILGLGNILRTEGIVFITAICIYYMVLIMKKENIKKLLCSFTLILVSYILIFQSTSILLTKLDISKNGLKNMNPTWKFVLGFNYESGGRWNAYDSNHYSNSTEISKQVVKERLKQYDKMPGLFLKKIKTMWLDSDLSWSIGHFDNTKLYSALNKINRVFIVFFDIMTVASFVLLVKKKFPKEQTIITSILFVYFGVYLLIEVQSRYAYSFQVFEAILCGISLDWIYKYKKIYRKKLK